MLLWSSKVQEWFQSYWHEHDYNFTLYLSLRFRFLPVLPDLRFLELLLLSNNDGFRLSKWYIVHKSLSTAEAAIANGYNSVTGSLSSISSSLRLVMKTASVLKLVPLLNAT